MKRVSVRCLLRRLLVWLRTAATHFWFIGSWFAVAERQAGVVVKPQSGAEPAQPPPSPKPQPSHPEPLAKFPPIEPPTIHFLHAAQGWMGLGDHGSAEAELAHIPILLRAHPDVLEVRWEIAAARTDWRLSLELARTLTKLAPDRRLGWIRLAQSLHRLDRTEEATKLLLGVANNFGENSAVPYHLARFYCALSRPAQARAWLERALTVAKNTGEFEVLRRRVSDDPNLERIWKEMETL